MSQAPQTPVEIWLGRSRSDPAQLRRATVAELNRLFGTRLATADLPHQSQSQFYRRVGQRLAAAAGGARALVLALVPEPARGGT